MSRIRVRGTDIYSVSNDGTETLIPVEGKLADRLSLRYFMRATLHTDQVNRCERQGCFNPPPYYRHHLGNDGVLARYSRRIRKGYYKYRHCARICDDCHMRCHFLYLPILRKWRIWTDAGVWRLRAKFITIGTEWLRGKRPNPIVTEEFRAQWQRSHSTWLAKQKQIAKR